jgi:NhaP-type Na+/H+ or K+/H+ antiporter
MDITTVARNRLNVEMNVMNTTSGSAHAEPRGSHSVFSFLFVGLLIGALINVAFAESKLPYTVLVFLAGMILGVIELHGEDVDFVESMRDWTHIDPDLILFVFIPALLFGEVTNLNLYHVKGAIAQALLLAGPGAVLCTVMVGFYMSADLLPFAVQWPANLSFVFGSIMSATDPVAVVALLSKSHGSLQRMKYIITGESILNDASALISFAIFSPRHDVGGAPMSPTEAVVYLVKVIIISPIVGGLIGLAGVIATSLTTRLYKEEHVVIHIAIPFCCAYLSFYVGQQILLISGIIACCTAGT